MTPASSGRRPRILVADDNDTFRRGLRELLEEYGMRVLDEARNGLEAVELALRLEPDILVMDVRMLVMGGVEAATMIKRRMPAVQVILLSAYADEDEAGASIPGLVFRYLVKGTAVANIRDALLDAWTESDRARAAIDAQASPPAETPTAGGAASPAEKPPSRWLPRVLVVDDERTILQALCSLLEEIGFDVVGSASNGAQAVELATELHPDVVLMDMRMPVLDGIEATRLIKRHDPSVQVVMLSAYEDVGIRQGAESAGAYCFLVKGCSPALIGDVLRAAAQHRREVVGQARVAVPR
jgi:YesN/AraC family two-component response regulator